MSLYQREGVVLNNAPPVLAEHERIVAQSLVADNGVGQVVISVLGHNMNKGHIRHHLYPGAVYDRRLLQDAVHRLLHMSGIHIHAVLNLAAVQVVYHMGVGFYMLMEHFKKLFFRVICGKMNAGFPFKAEKGVL